MTQKETGIVSSIAKINIGILLVFNVLFIIALNSDDVYLNLPTNIVALAVVFTVFFYLVFSGLREFNHQKAELKIRGKIRIIKYSELGLNILSFVFLGVAAFLLSFYNIQTTSGFSENMVVPSHALYTNMPHKQKYCS